MQNITEAMSKLRSVTFAVASTVEVCTESGSYNREVAARISRTIRCDINKVIDLLADIQKTAKEDE